MGNGPTLLNATGASIFLNNSVAGRTIRVGRGTERLQTLTDVEADNINSDLLDPSEQRDIGNKRGSWASGNDLLVDALT